MVVPTRLGDRRTLDRYPAMAQRPREGNVSTKERDKNAIGSRSDEAARSEVTSKALHPGRVPDLEPGKYSDGHPLDEVHYLE